MGALLDTLSFSDSCRRTDNADPRMNLRRRMAAALEQQALAAEAFLKGEVFTVEVEKWVQVDKATGAKERVKTRKKFRPMWYINGAGQVSIELRFSNKLITVNNKPSIVCTKEQLAATLHTIGKAVLLGELDQQLRIVSDARRRTLKLPTSKAAEQQSATAAKPAPKAGAK